MLTKEEIIQKLKDNHIRIADMVSGLSEYDFTATPAGKWSAGQQLDHIYRGLKPLTMAIGLPKIAVKILIGTANRPSKDYNGLVDKYHGVLDNGAKASGKYVPELVLYKDKDKLVGDTKGNLAKLVSDLNKYSEDDLDKYMLPHPLIGKLTVREMLYFTIYHSEHHYKMALLNLGRQME